VCPKQCISSTFISTDKACSPINIYGASKFASEKIFTNYDKKKIQTKFMVTRFGNILQSTGSVIPIFIEKIRKGEDITLTDEGMTRFIVDKTEAVEIIFDALRYGIGGEIFSKRFAAMYVVDLIDIIKKHFNAHNTVKVIGLRPGEKMHEALLNREEMARAFVFNNLFIIQPSIHNFAHDYDVLELPVYVRFGSRITPGQETHYSSDQAVLAKE
jgi:FlaA1/EpsC-like NDP-sugar epimerase